MPGIDKIKLKNIYAALKKNKLDGIILSDFNDLNYLVGEIFVTGEASILLHKNGMIVVARPLYEENITNNFPQAKFIPLEQDRYKAIIAEAKKLKLKAVAFDEEKEYYYSAKFYKKAGFKTFGNFKTSRYDGRKFDNLSKTSQNLAPLFLKGAFCL